jgi:hypothetical protein
MTLATMPYRSDLETLTSAIAQSPIVVAVPAAAVARLPAGYDQVDVAILRWIAVEGRRIGDFARH